MISAVLRDECLPYSVIIKEAPFWSRQGQMQRLTARERELIEYTALNGMPPSNSSLQSSGNHTQEEPEEQVPLNQLSMNSLRVKQEAQGLHKSIPGPLHV